MNTLELVSYLRSIEVSLKAEGNRLRCSAPKGTLTPELSARIAQKKTDILAFLNQADHLAGIPYQTIPVTPRGKSLALSFAQQRLWFLDQLEPNKGTYNLPAAYRFKGDLNLSALEQSLNILVCRHEILRTTFTEQDGGPVQQPAPFQPFVLVCHDLTTIAATARHAAARHQAQREAQQPFDLAHGPLCRFNLLQLTETTHWLLVTLHHIVADGWSFEIFEQEFENLYLSLSQGREPTLPALPIQYADFAQWQRHWWQSERLATQLQYWKQQLAGLSPVLALPTDRPRPALQTYRGAKCRLHIPQPLVTALEQLSQTAGCTLFMTLLAAFQMLLARYSGQTDIAVGSPIAGRSQVETEGLIGLFINTLVLRTNLAGNPRVNEVLERVRTMALAAYAHQDLPFEQLVEELNPTRALSHSPFFQVMLILRNASKPLFPALPDLQMRREFVDPGTAMFDLTVYAQKTDQGLGLTFEYNTDLFDATTIERMGQHWRIMLEGMVAHPEQRLTDLPLLSSTEQQQLAAWNTTAVAFPPARGFHQHIEAQVARTPTAIAVQFETQTLTYTALNERANQLAHYLRRQGIGPNIRVGLYMQRSLELLIGLLGIVKAGGTYVPLDPSYPHDRIAFMLTDAQVALVITQARLHAQLPTANIPSLCLDTAQHQLEQEGPENLTSDVTSTHIAYIIYTSGSTGTPKGVQISHGALENFLLAMRQEPGLQAHDILLAVTTIAFDIAGLELYLPLVVGGQVVLVSQDVAKDGHRLVAALQASKATIMQATPATWRLLLEAGWTGTPGLTMLCGGETLPRTLATQLLECGTALWNMYGPTETTIWSAVHRVAPGEGPVPIGRPIANTQFHLLDPQGHPVPIGVPGELHIGGHGLAQGYVGQAALTHEKFISHPFTPAPESRLYKTGDLMRYRPDGTLEFFGRLDHQVKVRGFRIECGEIEAVLRQHPTVHEALVLVPSTNVEDPQLVAYVQPVDTARCESPQLYHFLRTLLPEYMLPTRFIKLDTFPLTANGKIDRQALPPPTTYDRTQGIPYLAPRTPLEELLVAIWQEVLELEQIGVHDNFFELGGHSLLATRVITLVRSTLELDCPLRTIFEQPTIAGFATIIDEQLPETFPDASLKTS